VIEPNVLPLLGVPRRQPPLLSGKINGLTDAFAGGSPG
jgi:hypothetical protein